MQVQGCITAPQAIGYKEVVAALDGNITLDEAREKIKIATHATRNASAHGSARMSASFGSTPTKTIWMR